AVLVFHRMGSLGSLGGDAVVGDGEVAVLDAYVPTAVDVNSIGAWRLHIVIRNLEARAADHDFLASVEVEVPELGILEGDALDPHLTGVLNEGQPRPLDAQIGEIVRVGRSVTQLPEQVPDRQP